MAERAVAISAQAVCRLCGGNTEFAFSGTVLGKYAINYWRCLHCRSLQTDEPYWLSESYKSVHSATDTGMVARTWQMARTASLMLRLAGTGPHAVCLDWGGGNGLFCRMMRDQGFNFYNDDKYADPFYCHGFTRRQCGGQPIDVITSFEVFEHLPNPANDLAQIEKLNPKLWIFSTQLYSSQDCTWKYLAPDTGRHVFFYSGEALSLFASARGYRFLRGREMHLFIRQSDNGLLQDPLPRKAVQWLLQGNGLMSAWATMNFVARQRQAHRHWQQDRAHIKSGFSKDGAV